MVIYEQKEVLLNIQQLIDRSRCSIDGFFIDSKTAASDILQYLERENIIAKSEPVQIEYSDASKAA